MKIKKIKTLDDLIANLQELQEIHGNLPLQREVELHCIFEYEIKRPYLNCYDRLRFYPRYYTCKTIGSLDENIRRQEKHSLKSAFLYEQDYNKLDKADLEELKKWFKDVKKQNIKNLQKPWRCLKIKKAKSIDKERY